jgi:vesicle coat complex subunit
MRENKRLEESLAIEFATIWRVLKAADTELEVYKNAVAALLTIHPELSEPLNALLVSARQDSALAGKINEKYVPILETLIRRLPDDLPPKVQEHIESLEHLG